MSKLTKYLDKPASMTADALVATSVGVCAFIVLGTVLPLVPILGVLTPAAAPSLAGVVGAATYLRARTNLLDPKPAFPNKPG